MLIPESWLLLGATLLVTLLVTPLYREGATLFVTPLYREVQNMEKLPRIPNSSSELGHGVRILLGRRRLRRVGVGDAPSLPDDKAGIT